MSLCQPDKFPSKECSDPPRVKGGTRRSSILLRSITGQVKVKGSNEELGLREEGILRLIHRPHDPDVNILHGRDDSLGCAW